MRYRPDVDGLRALAVSSVVLFHIGTTGVTGGYIGVDIFFVISGYLITSIISSEISCKTFSVLHFYERRIRRIFPALFLVMGVTVLVGMFVLLPMDMEEFGGSVVSTTVFVSNIFFWNQSGYFDGPAELKPLLHTWSLAVEEQFYIFYPIILLVLVRISSQRWARLALVAAAIVSFVLSVWAVNATPVAAFYWSPPRAWELLLGALIALNVLPALKSQVWREIAGAAGLMAMIGSAALLDAETPFPGAAALPACLGAMLFIHAHETGSSIAGRMMSIRPIVFVGLISYSLYLWHWPIFAFARYVNIEPLSLSQSLFVIVTSVCLATLSWRYVERPFRKVGPPQRRKFVFVSAGVLMLGAAAVGASFVLLHGAPNRLPAVVVAVADEDQYRTTREECHLVFGQHLETLCVRGAGGEPPSFLLVGDSHAGAVADAVFDAAELVGMSG